MRRSYLWFLLLFVPVLLFLLSLLLSPSVGDSATFKVSLTKSKSAMPRQPRQRKLSTRMQFFEHVFHEGENQVPIETEPASAYLSDNRVNMTDFACQHRSFGQYVFAKKIWKFRAD
ncbi:uncharacterized protein LOC126788780 [Argentina anserina]|uniref:uncharacterized protein LOC126788780 n=1 Tax=Argentina anserina TaxID=57926 RepID=UPI002176232E|nr:uncharacterized protein LOC126788780 [Potentilla anserina]